MRPRTITLCNNKGMQVKETFFSPCVCVLLIVKDITFNETAGRGSDIRENPEVDS